MYHSDTFEEAKKEKEIFSKAVPTSETKIAQDNKTKDIEKILKVTHNFEHVDPILKNVPNPFEQKKTENLKRANSRGKFFLITLLFFFNFVYFQ